MALTIGIIGLPNVGKSTLLNALASAGAEASNYPFCTIECNKGVVTVPDERLDRLAEILRPDKVIPSHITYVDIAGLVEGASRGEGLGNKFLHHIREADVLVHVLRCFDDPDITHVFEGVDPVRDLQTVETELFLSDLDRVGKWIGKEREKSKAVRKGERKDLGFLEKIKGLLSEEKRIDQAGMNEHQLEAMAELGLLTQKPMILVLNSGESEEADCLEGQVSTVRDHHGHEPVVISARVEEELAELPENDREEYMRELGIEAEARKSFIERCHSLLGLVRYYTAANGKLQAWSILEGTKAPDAAGMIHSDMRDGFIRAKVMSYADLDSHGSEAEVQHQGHLRTEGHDYIIKDGDVIQYLFKR
ncbi:MAG: redox-regulated ATPase YchF [Candidatus Krumholzibacteria bacterium]|nr:redox-regulated ATPase YchF [Candidatus Krumholzibacteria bacterium]